MRLLVLFLIITNFFILFNLLSISDGFNHHHRYHHHYHHQHHHQNNDNHQTNNWHRNNRYAPAGYNGNNNNNRVTPDSPTPARAASGSEEQDNIASTLPQSFHDSIDDKVIRESRLEEPSPSSSTISLYDDKNPNLGPDDNNQKQDGHNSIAQTSSSASSLASVDDGGVGDNIVGSTQYQSEALSPLYGGIKTNSLIEWASEKQDNSNGDTTQYKHHHQFHHCNQANHNVRTRRDGMSTGSLFSTDKLLKHDGTLAATTDSHFKWCNKLCDINNPNARHNHPICASNGRFYSSNCELKRYSCRHSLQLFKKPQIYCSKQRHDVDSITSFSDKQSNNTEQVRIVELKRRCNKKELDEMKTLLLNEFGGNLASMFGYLDLNGDNYIEAHELWPRKDIESNKLMYAQVWDNHSKKCPSHKFGLQHHSQIGYRLVEDQSKCWFFLDFAFQPKFATNPCSLSHLMLFDLTHPSSKFDWDTFQDAFRSIYKGNNSLIEAPSVQDQKAIRIYSQLDIMLGESTSLHCFDNNSNSLLLLGIKENSIGDNDIDNFEQIKCLWTRYNLNLAALRDPHVYVGERIGGPNRIKGLHELALYLKDAQLYLSGQFKCMCNIKYSTQIYEHIYNVKVLAQPRVDVRPHSQWSLPNSKISFECHYDYIDTSNGEIYDKSSKPDSFRSDLLSLNNTKDDLQQKGQFGLRVKWLKDNQDIFYLPTASNVGEDSDRDVDQDDAQKLSPISERASTTMASSRLSLENLRLKDSGLYTCQVEVPKNYTYFQNEKKPSTSASSSSFSDDDYDDDTHNDLMGQDHGTLLVQERPKTDQSAQEEYSPGTNLWMFHDNGISIYRLQNDDGQEMELLREINGHSLVSGEVDGNWNQLTLCGGLNPEQVVICEWSDNALFIDADNKWSKREKGKEKKKSRKYIYIGQPNLNRIIVMDGLMFEIVAIINTEPQPRKLHLYKPNKIHLSKWVRRRLSPMANARWMSAIGLHAHPLKSTPESELYSNKPLSFISSKRHTRSTNRKRQQENRVEEVLAAASRPSQQTFAPNQRHSALVQHDIWLLCYGQPMVVDPSGEEPSNVEDSSSFYSAIVDTSPSTNNTLLATTLASSTTPAIATTNQGPHRASINNGGTIQPFTPRLTTGGSPFAWSAVWPNKESKLRNRKSVHIIQSTFFPRFLNDYTGTLHSHDQGNYTEQDNEETPRTLRLRSNSSHRTRNNTVVGTFKRSTVLTTHHVFAGLARTKTQQYLNRAQFDLIQDLFVPPKPYSLNENENHKIHYAYVTHYDDQRLFRVSMDDYSYDREIDLQDCDPINMMTTAQGILVIQCRAPITHNLIGQLVLDELTSLRIEFNANIRAQESYLSPDHRYLISIYTNSTSSTSTSAPQQQQRKRSILDQSNKLQHGQSVVYVQLVTISGLKLQYEIKTFLDISQCSFVWKDGYYAAIFVSSNHREQQSEILSLRLVDSRLELMARVPGLVSTTRHKDQLVISPELQLAALSTNQGTYVVDLEDNRVSQSLRHHQAPPTLLWV